MSDKENNSYYCINIDKSDDKPKDGKDINIFDTKKNKKEKIEMPFGIVPEEPVDSFREHSDEKKAKEKTKDKTKQKTQDDVFGLESNKRDYKITKHIKRSLKRRKSSNSKNNSTRLSVLLVYGIIVFVIGSILVYRYSYICNEDIKLDEMQAEIDEMNLKIDSKSLELSLLDDISKIEAIAKSKLGMYYPDNSQIEYIDLDKSIE